MVTSEVATEMIEEWKRIFILTVWEMFLWALIL